MQTLVIDTSYGSTVGVVGHEPIVETDSRTHVEKLQVNIAHAVEQAGLRPTDIERIVVGIGPAPFTGLRAGIVAAKALAFATGAELVGQDALSPQTQLVDEYASDDACHLTLAINDARRRQLYFMLMDSARGAPCPEHWSAWTSTIRNPSCDGSMPRLNCCERIVRTYGMWSTL